MLTCTSHSTPSPHAHKHTSSTQRHKHNRLERLTVTQVSIVVDFKASAFAALFSLMFDDDTKTKCAAFEVWVSVLSLLLMEHLPNNTSQKSGGTFGVREAEVLGGDSMCGAAEGNLRSACVCSSYRCNGGEGGSSQNGRKAV